MTAGAGLPPFRRLQHCRHELRLGYEACRRRHGPVVGAPVSLPHVRAPAILFFHHMLEEGHRTRYLPEHPVHRQLAMSLYVVTSPPSPPRIVLPFRRHPDRLHIVADMIPNRLAEEGICRTT